MYSYLAFKNYFNKLGVSVIIPFTPDFYITSIYIQSPLEILFIVQHPINNENPSLLQMIK